MNNDRLIKIYSDLNRFFLDLKAINITSSNDLTENIKYHAVSMLLFSILNRTIDLGEEIILKKGFSLPDSYKSVFEILNKEKIISNEDYQKLREMVNLRNLIAHQYYAFDENDIFKVYSDLDVISKFITTSQSIFKV